MQTDYFYYSADGIRPLLKIQRIENDGSKKFFQYHFDGTTWKSGRNGVAIAPYDYPKWKDKKNEPIFIVEGEKCAERLKQEGLCSTTTPGGANSWKKDFAAFFTDRAVVILPDNDLPGKKYAENIQNDLFGVAKSVKLVNLPNLSIGEDVVEYLTKNTKEDLIKLIPNEQNKPSKVGPLPLFRALPPPEKYPTAALGEILAPAVGALVDSIQAPPALCAQSILAAATLAVQPFSNVEIDGRNFPISNFFLTVGESGERKTAIDNIALKIHREKEKLDCNNYLLAKNQFDLDKEAFELTRKNPPGIKGLSVEEISNELEKLGSSPRPPISQIMLIQEPTFEGLIKLFDFNKPSLGLFTDEGGRVVGGHAMNKDNQLKTISGYSSLWDGKPISRVRSGEGSINFYGKRLSIHIMMQPIVIRQLTSNNMVSEQGFLARCLLAFPESTVGSRIYQQIDLSSNKYLIHYQNVISSILNVPLPLSNESRTELNPKMISLSTEAKKLWIQFHDFVEGQLAEGGQFYSIRSFGSKAAEQSLRLAAVLTLIENIEATEISALKIQSGIDLMHFYLSEALRLYNASTINPDLTLADKLLKWCDTQTGRYIHLAQVYQYGPNSVRDKSTARKVIKTLEEHGYLTPETEGMVLDGKHRKEVWRVEK